MGAFTKSTRFLEMMGSSFDILVSFQETNVLIQLQIEATKEMTGLVIMWMYTSPSFI